MLNIIYGDVKNSIYNTNVYFKNSYEPEWLDAELAKKMIKDIDDSEVLSGECINSPVLGQIPPERLSGGVKTLLLILNEQIGFSMPRPVAITVQNGYWKLAGLKMLPLISDI